jgi:hypothetical protein
MNTKAILKNLTSNTPFQDFKMGCKLKIVMYYILLILVELLLLYFVSKKVMQEAGRLFFRLTKSKKWSTYLFAIFFLPGTFIHEASHFLAALILFVPVGQFELIPEFIEEDRLKLGSVPVAKSDFLRRFLIAIAPIIAGLTILFFLPSLLSIHRCIDSWYVLVPIHKFYTSGVFYPPLQKTMSVGSWMNVKIFLFRRDFTPDLPCRQAGR